MKNPEQISFHIYYYEPKFNLGFTPILISIANSLYLTVKKILLYPDLNIQLFAQHCDTVVSLTAKNWNDNITNLLLLLDLNYVPRIEDGT